jgi:hypothetical protein
MITDFSKYKRVFAFGCSFTSWIYPTWAQIINKSCNTDVEFYNMAKAGGGNIYIANRLTEANRVYKFNEDDLVILMWSTFCRIDYYDTENGGWKTPGNIFTQSMIDINKIKPLLDPNGFIIRDFSIIELTTAYLNSLPCDVLKFMSVPLNYNNFQNILHDKISDRILNTYQGLDTEYGSDVFQFLGNRFSGGIKYHDSNHGPGLTNDYHPTPVDYCNYLLSKNVPITPQAIQYAHDSLDKINKFGKTREIIFNMFDEEINSSTRHINKLMV